MNFEPQSDPQTRLVPSESMEWGSDFCVWHSRAAASGDGSRSGRFIYTTVPIARGKVMINHWSFCQKKPIFGQSQMVDCSILTQLGFPMIYIIFGILDRILNGFLYCWSICLSHFRGHPGSMSLMLDDVHLDITWQMSSQNDLFWWTTPRACSCSIMWRSLFFPPKSRGVPETANITNSALAKRRMMPRVFTTCTK